MKLLMQTLFPQALWHKNSKSLLMSVLDQNQAPLPLLLFATFLCHSFLDPRPPNTALSSLHLGDTICLAKCKPFWTHPHSLSLQEHLPPFKLMPCPSSTFFSFAFCDASFSRTQTSAPPTPAIKASGSHPEKHT